MRGGILSKSESRSAGEGIFSPVLITRLLRHNKRIAFIMISCGAYDAAWITRKGSRGPRTHRRARTSPRLLALRDGQIYP